jgi:hypothetical protein
MNILQRDTNTITIANFWENFLLNKYNFNPVYQRKSVWTEEKQSFFIDSILKNFPIPPIFLHQHIDDNTGKTIYDVIDGKQRLESIIKFIQNIIPVSNERQDNNNTDQALAGAYFQDLDRPELQEYKRRFWRYVIPIEYIDTQSTALIDDIFDRLNRNGEPLTGQELRHATYHSTNLMRMVQELAATTFWSARLRKLDRSRMEDLEFLSELLFVILEGGPQEADQELLDRMYQKYANKEGAFNEAATRQHFNKTTTFMEGLNLDYDGLKIAGASHLYGLWCFSWYCTSNNIALPEVANAILQFFDHLRRSNEHNEQVESYRKTMSYQTKSRSQRTRRLTILKTYAGIT